ATKTSIGVVLIAGVLQGLRIAVSKWGISYIISRKNHFRVTCENATWIERSQYFNRAKWTVIMPVVVLGGIDGGIFTATEAAGVDVAYSALLSLIYREIKWKDTIELFKRTTLISGIILIIIATASTYARILTVERIPVKITDFLVSLPVSTWVILSLIVLLLIFIGMFMETIAGIILLAPILLPVVTELGVHLEHL